MSEQFGLHDQGDGTAVLTIDGRPVLRVDASPARTFEHAVRRLVEVRTVSVFRPDESFVSVEMGHPRDLGFAWDPTVEDVVAAVTPPWRREQPARDWWDAHSRSEDGTP